MCIGIGAAGAWSNTARFLGMDSTYCGPTSPLYLQSAVTFTEAAVSRDELVDTDSMPARLTSSPHSQSTERTTETPAPRFEEDSVTKAILSVTDSLRKLQSLNIEKTKETSRARKELFVRAIKLVAAVSLVCLYPKLALEALLVTFLVIYLVTTLAVLANLKEINFSNYNLFRSNPQLLNLVTRQVESWIKSLSGNLQNIFKLS